MYQKVKRLLDILISLIALVVLSPVLLATALLVRVRLGSPVIFHQERPGYHEKIFKLCKFRTMTDARGQTAHCCPTSSVSRASAKCCARQALTSCRSCGTY